MEFIRNLTITTVIRQLLYVLIFFQPFNHFNSFREISFYVLVMLFLIKLFRGEVKQIAFKDKTVIAILIILAWSLIVSITGPYPLESLDAIRQNLLKEIVIFLIVISEFKSLRAMKPLLWTVVSSFAAVTVASIFENAIKDWDTFCKFTPALSWRGTSTFFFANYADNATFYLPFIAGWLISIKEDSWKKWTGGVTLAIGVYLVYIYNARTHLITIPFAIFIILLLTKRYKLIMVSLLAGVLCLSLVLSSNNNELSRYKSMFNPKTYDTENMGLNSRPGLWQVVIYFIKERPLNGYGYGWKKMAWLVQEKHSDEFWKEYPAMAYDYYVNDAQLMYGRVNPHNLVLQLAIEIGIIGLAIFIWLWATVLAKILSIIRANKESEIRGFMLSSIGLLISYAMVNITNGYWQENYGLMMFLFMAIIFVMHREFFRRSIQK